jgi:hypothetical protein
MVTGIYMATAETSAKVDAMDKLLGPSLNEIRREIGDLRSKMNRGFMKVGEDLARIELKLFGTVESAKSAHDAVEDLTEKQASLKEVLDDVKAVVDATFDSRKPKSEDEAGGRSKGESAE